MESEENNMSLRVASFSCYLDSSKENMIRRISAPESSPLVGKTRTMSPSVKASFHGNVFPNQKDESSNLSYLNAAGENIVFKVPAAPVKDPGTVFTFPLERPKDGEISVFGADRYFNVKLEYETSKRDNGYIKRKDMDSVNNNIMGRTGSSRRGAKSSAFSEASSWTSQTEMLKKMQREQQTSQISRQKKSVGWRIFAGFGCQVPCFDHKDDKMMNKVENTRISTSNGSNRAISQRISHLPIHVLTPSLKLQEKEEDDEIIIMEEEDPGRKSLEVFGSSASSKRDVATNLERKLSMLTWDAIPKRQTIKNPASTIETSNTVCEDMASDASSDLFEIENISGCINQIISSSKPDINLQDDISCMSPTSHYAPSEASIQWSVITASAADYSSMISDYEEKSVSIAGDMFSRSKTSNKNGGTKEAQKLRQGGGLLGCKSQKAVDVAETACHLVHDKVKH